MARLIWWVMCGNGWPIGIPQRITSTRQPATQAGRRREILECVEEGVPRVWPQTCELRHGPAAGGIIILMVRWGSVVRSVQVHRS